MNSALKHIVDYIESNSYRVTDEEIIDTLRDAKELWKSNGDKHRWWTIYTYVVEINGMYIGFEYAENTGDMSVREAGYEFNIDSICEYEPKKIKTTIYVPKS
jgi:hypothetical protein